MKTVFNPKLKAILSVDNSEIVRQINHSDEFYSCGSDVPRTAALEYLNEVSDILKIPGEYMRNAYQMVSYFQPVKQETEYRLSEEKTFFDSTTLGFYQTYLNVPVWRTGMSVTIKHGPNRVIAMTNNSQLNVKATLPSEKKINSFKLLIQQASPERGKFSARIEKMSRGVSSLSLEAILGLKPERKTKNTSTADRDEARVKLIRGRFYVYQYNSKKRQVVHEHISNDKEENHKDAGALPLPKVNSSIKEGNYYLVTEITFSYDHINWLMLVEVETSSILYLEALCSGVNGQVFVQDPITRSGVATNTPDKSNAILNPFRDTIVLPNLDAPIMSTQNLRGRFAEVSDVTTPAVAPPTNPSGTDFNYAVRTDNFAAVNAYYHTDRFFSMVENLGFDISTYFNNTTFPVPIDHRGRGFAPGTTTHTGTGVDINAHCAGDGTDGIAHCCYMLDDLGDTANPMGIASDWRVHLHELGGHGILYEHVGTPNFGFSHSAGDSLAIIVNDPDSNAPDRFLLAPFVPAVTRRSDRPVGTWAWGGTNDVAGYSSEQILSTTLFRIYRSIGGDSTNLNRRKFASEMMAYLILRTVSTFTPGTNPSNALLFCNAMMATDLLNWISRGLFGGAYNKVVRWSFEKQGLFQPAGAPTPVTAAGAAPAVDVYIEDGRNGEYQFQAVHWNCTSIWNNNSSVFNTIHEEPILAASNNAYVKLKNRGTQIASGITVRAFHCKPGAGLMWPNDFEEMTYMGGAIGTINPNSTEEITVGPFSWIPNINAYGHDCILMVASATNDASNIDNFGAGEVIEEWRLVPNDNNIAQRNVNPIPGGGGMDGLVMGLQDKSFWVGNPNRKAALMTVKVELPKLLTSKNWDIAFKGIPKNEFRLKPSEKRELVFDLTIGAEFSKAEVENADDRNITISIYADDALIGGMTYYLDANLKAPINTQGAGGTKCTTKARELLKCLSISDQNVKSVKVKKISLDIEMNDGHCH